MLLMNARPRGTPGAYCESAPRRPDLPAAFAGSLTGREAPALHAMPGVSLFLSSLFSVPI